MPELGVSQCSQWFDFGCSFLVFPCFSVLNYLRTELLDRLIKLQNSAWISTVAENSFKPIWQ